MARWLLLYDGRCLLCRWAVRAALAADRRGALEPVTFDAARARGLDRGLGLGGRLEEAFHLVGEDGGVRSGADALPLLAELLGGGAAAWALQLGPVRAGAARGYAWVAAHRGALSRLLPPLPPGREAPPRPRGP